MDVQAASAGGELSAPDIQDPGSSQQRVTDYHPKSPPPPSRIEDIPPNSMWFVLEFEQGLWSLTLDKDMLNSEVIGLPADDTDCLLGLLALCRALSSKDVPEVLAAKRTTTLLRASHYQACLICSSHCCPPTFKYVW